jgi:hypothetical protein
MEIDKISGEVAKKILSFVLTWHPELKGEIESYLRFLEKEEEERESLPGE